MVRIVDPAIDEALKKGVAVHEAGTSRAQSPDNQDPPQDNLQPLIHLYGQGRMQRVLDQASKLLQHYPNSPTVYNIMGASNLRLKLFDAAIECFQQVLSITPDHAEAYSNIGVALKDKGDLEAAIGSFEHAIKIMPGYFQAFYNKANALKEMGDLEAAIESYRQAIRIKPDYAEAYYNMGNAQQDKGDLEAAMDSYRQAIRIKPDHAGACLNVGTVLKSMVFRKPAPGLPELILELLKRKTFVRPKDVVAAAISLLRLDPNIKAVLEKQSADQVEQSLEQTVSDLNKVPLLLELMSVCPLPDLELEAVLASIRSAVLLNISEISVTAGTLRFQSALALQCFTNEYVYDQTGAETEALEALEKAVGEKLLEGQQPDPSHVACLASYKALHEYSWRNLLSFPAELETLERRLIAEFEKEQRIRSEMPVLQEINDNVSSKVREQYEENPYPRWVNLRLPLNPKPVSKIVRELNLRLADSGVNEVETPQILVAGCGTGQHAIDTASRFRNCNVLAIDLSLSSLAYARRKTEELGITNIEYLQADILDLRKLDKQFDIVESAGVLHHMDKPMAGWRVLADCLKPAGLMMIGLYSELARQHITAMRDEIRHLDIGSSNSAMRSYRNDIISSDLQRHKQLLSSTDFYSLSTLRDLLFHVQEHRFTLPQIQNCLAGLGLTFCGFQNDAIVKAFKSRNPDDDALYDLGKWNAFEQDNPRIFEGMYQFWCQKLN